MFSFSSTQKPLFDTAIPSFRYEDVDGILEIGMLSLFLLLYLSMILFSFTSEKSVLTKC